MIRTVRPESVRYQIEECIGEGSMAVVYKAVRIDSRGFSRQTVALKVLKSASQVHSLVSEMDTLTKVRSSHCVSFLGWENLPEGPAIVMEWVNGVSLELLLRIQRLGGDLADEIGAQIQSGLADLKNAGLCHGDLSPANVLIDTEGRVRLVDFGLSRLNERGCIAGTPQFMAPERWRGEPAAIEGDLFSLGLLMEDLKNGRIREPRSNSDWQARAGMKGGERGGWLALAPAERGFIELKSKPGRRARLGHFVAAALSLRRQRVRTIHADQTRTMLTRAAKNAALALAPSFKYVALVLVVLFPITPFGQSGRVAPVPSARLEIRTARWVQIKLGFLDLGYSPIVKADLPAGLHRISWKSHSGSGSKIISIGFGETKVLTDRDF